MTSGISAYVRRHHLGLIAIFIALTGTAVAATTAPRDSVTSKSIKKGAVKSVDVKDGNLTGADVKDDSLTGADIAESTLKLPAAGSTGSPPSGPAGGSLAGTYPNPTIAAGAVGSSQLAASAVTSAKLGPPLTLSASAASSPVLHATNTSTTSTQPGLSSSSDSTEGGAVGLLGRITSTAPGGFSAAVRGQNAGSGGLGIGVYGSQAGSGWGVYGTTPSGIGVHGNSSDGFGVYGLSTNGVGVYALSSNGPSLQAQITNNANANPAVWGETNGTGPSVKASRSGVGTALTVSGGLQIAANGSSGSPAFVHTVTNPGSACNGNTMSVIDNPYANNVPGAMLLVTHTAGSGGAAFNHPVGVVYDNGTIPGCTDNRWLIRTEDATALSNGLQFNVLVITP